MPPPACSARLGRLDAFTGRRDEAMARMERAFAVISADEPDEDLALLAARLARGYWFSGDLERAAERAELALDIAEAHAYPAALAVALRAKAGIAQSRGTPRSPQALLKRSLEIALDHDLADEAGNCYFNLSDQCFRRDEYTDALGYLDEALALAGSAETVRTNGLCWPSGPTRCTCSAAGTRRRRRARSSPRSRSTPAGSC